MKYHCFEEVINAKLILFLIYFSVFSHIFDTFLLKLKKGEISCYKNKFNGLKKVALS